MATYNTVITNISGSVGIGTTSVTSRLTVLGNASNLGEQIATFKPGGLQTGGSGVLDVQNSAGSSIFFVSGSGNVGIGISTPGERLTITRTASEASVAVGNGTYYGYFGFANAAGNYAVSAQANDTVVRGQNGVTLAGNQGNAGGIRISSSNFVGIGTTNPLVPVHINNSGGEQLWIRGGGAGYLFCGYDQVSDRGRIGAYTSTGYTTLLLNEGGGNIGIGTAIPNAQLTLYNASMPEITLKNSSNYTRFSVNGNDFYLDVGQGTAGGGSTIFRRGNGTAEHVRFDSSGNVGIGTSLFTDKLAVNGSVSVTGSLLPGVDNNYSLGSSGKRWSEVRGVNVYGQFFPSSGTPGSVLYINSSGLLAQDNSNLFWNDSTKNLGISGQVYASSFVDIQNSSYLVNPASTSVLNLVNATGFYDADGGNARRFVNPGGGALTTQTPSITGALKIRFPSSRNNSSTMIILTVKIYEYVTGRTQEYRIGGYNYFVGNWYNVFAYNLTDSGSNYSIRFGYDGTSDCIWIGETSTGWNCPQAYITEVLTGYSGFSADWSNGWALSWVTAFDTVEQGPYIPNRFWGNNNDGAGSGLDADLLDGYHAASFGLGTGTQNYVAKWTATSNALGNSQIYDDATNVGIGTSTTHGKLAVYKDGTGNTEILTLKTTYPSDSTYKSLTWRDGSNITGQIDTRYNGTTVDMVFGSLYNGGYNTAERLRITGAGNIGIGTTNATAKLTISSSSPTSVDIGLNRTFSVVNNNTGSINFVSVPSVGTRGSHDYGSIVVKGNSPSGINDGGSSVFELKVGGASSAASDIGVFLKGESISGASNGPDMVSIFSRSIRGLVVSGTSANVGIGTSSPAYPLHVYRSGLADGSTNTQLMFDGKFSVAGIDQNDMIGMSSRLENSGGGSQTTFNIGFSYQAGANAILLQPTSGYVGIGTNNPSAKLHVVSGDIRFNSTYGIIGGTNTAGYVLRGDNTRFVPAQLQYSDLGGTPTIGNATLTVGVSGTGLSVSATPTFTANATANNTITITSNATSSNTVSTLVARDASGDFSAGRINAIIDSIGTEASRVVTTTPETLARAGVVFDFKTNGTNALTDGGSYHGLMTFRQYGGGTDWTGGRSHQLGFTDNDNVWHRSGTSTTWGTWYKFYHTGNLTNPATGTGTNNYVARWTGTSSLSTGVLYDNATNVGIGTNIPLSLLSIGEGSLVNHNIPVQISTGGPGTEKWYGINKNGNYGFVAGFVYDQGAVLRVCTTDPLILQTNNTQEAMRIDSSQRVGIGDTDPGNHYGESNRLVIRNDNNGLTALSVTNATVGASAVVRIGMIGGTGNSYTRHELYDNNGNPYLNHNIGQGVKNYNIRMGVGGNTVMVLSGSSTGATVGVGISAGAVSPYSAGGYGWLVTNGSSGAVFSHAQSGTELFRIQSDGAAHNILGISNVPMIFKTVSYEAMRIDTSQRIGIGTTITSNKLSVYDSSQDQIYIRGTSTNRSGIRIDNTAGYQSQILLADGGADKWQFGKQTDNTFFLYDATATKNIIQGTYRNLGRSDIAFVPYQDGRAGIGTDPSTNGKLEIYATGSLQGIHQGDGTRWLKILAGTATVGAYNNIVLNNDSAIIFSGGVPGTGAFVLAPWAGATSGLRIDASGQVGIGTATMSRSLVVHGSDALINGRYVGG